MLLCLVLRVAGIFGFSRINSFVTKKEWSISLEERLTLRLLTSYIYGAPILDVSRSHTTTQHSR
jgi:hypothetical protein